VTTIYSWNVNGVRAVIKKNTLRPFVEAENPDILCLQETKAKEHQVELDVAGYHDYWNSAVKPGYSGTAILSKTKPLRLIENFPAELSKKYQLDLDGYGDPDHEGRVLAAEYPKFWVVTVYTPNAKDDLSRLDLRHKHWDPAFLEYLKQLEQEKPVIFCGDLNVAHTELDLANPKANKGKKGFTNEERAGFQSFINAGFVDTFRLFEQAGGFYSWWSHFANSRARNVGWRIDYVLVSKTLAKHVSAAKIHPSIMGSDHCPVSVTLDI
jgi:exodeoxyribonuclease-3